MEKEINVKYPWDYPEGFCYKYCYECGLVLGKPDFTNESVWRDIRNKHRGHCTAQSQHDNAHK